MKKNPYLIIGFSLFIIMALFGAARTFYIINPARCDGCGSCLIFCPNNAIYFDQELMIMRIDDQLCDGCGECLYCCPHSAIIEPDSTAYILGSVSGSDTGFPIRDARIYADSFYCSSGIWGDYYLNLTPGIYDITCTAEGYIDQTVYNVELSSEDFVRQDFILETVGTEDNNINDQKPRGYFSPNPFLTETNFIMDIKPVDKDFILEIYNLKGQKIRNITSENMRGSSIYWNGNDHTRQKVPAGVYLYKFSNNRETYSGKLTLLPD